MPSNSVIAAITKSASDSLLSEQIQQALLFLLEDTNSAVVFGSASVLSRIKGTHIRHNDSEGGYLFDGLLVENEQIALDESVFFQNSILDRVLCEDCRGQFKQSISIDNFETEKIRRIKSFELDRFDTVIKKMRQPSTEGEYVHELDNSLAFQSTGKTYGSNSRTGVVTINSSSFSGLQHYQSRKNGFVCDEWDEFSLNNPFWIMRHND